MKTVLNYLDEQKQMAWHNRLCYSKSYDMEAPKDGYEKEFDNAVRDCEIVDELIQIVKEKEKLSTDKAWWDVSYEQVEEVIEPYLIDASEKHLADLNNNELRIKEDVFVFLVRLAHKECMKPLDTEFDKFMDIIQSLTTQSSSVRIEKTGDKELDKKFKVTIADRLHRRYSITLFFLGIDGGYFANELIPVFFRETRRIIVNKFENVTFTIRVNIGNTEPVFIFLVARSPIKIPLNFFRAVCCSIRIE
jgi:hypothetical protein